MSGIDDIKNKAQEVAGKVKEAVGEKTDNDDLAAEGQADQGEAKVKGAVESVKDKITGN